jgi:DNA mismatch endonuclease (patch repair protein)
MPRSFKGSPISTPRSSAASNFSRDPLSPEARSALMKRVRLRDTKPEQIVRRMLHGLGLRFTVNGPYNRSLPSRPDIVLPRWQTVILVHGCFWHRHRGCHLTSTPSNRGEFWRGKFDANVKRDQVQRKKLRALGWRVVTIWECETRKPVSLERKLGKIFVPLAKSLKRSPSG